MPKPKGAVPIIQTSQNTDGELVQANQNRPTGKKTQPTIPAIVSGANYKSALVLPGGSLASGGARPPCLAATLL